MFNKDIFVDLKCTYCGNNFKRPRWRHQDHLKRGDKRQFCSISCRNKYQAGITNFGYKRGYTINKGYKRISFGSNKGRYEHEIILETYLGRKLEPKECVHHISGDRADNRIENLVLCRDNSNHIKKYHIEKGRKGFKKGVRNVS